ncbi:ABC transporter ATP-binding protein [Acrocarpospora macrocephala]|uniref:ABC transporter ATP-binding protein n=1 Tax=Acrocarpospora macrocephala TaxID=150177 RepID=A0A5M3X682_9ACTN|nr:ABC transporter ATP-binding protein [Acrocarpospora macrocephala]GES15659.1 ABC transporter ATP-binding protein [Acrocarpospora macrocephala]
MATVVLQVRDLAVEFSLRGSVARAVDGVGFDVRAGEIVGMVGESGSGKSVTMLALLGLVPRPGRIVAGSVRLRDIDLGTLSLRELAQLRGRQMALIPSDAGAALNPVTRIGAQVGEGLAAHLPDLPRAERPGRILDILRRVGLPRPEHQVRRYPHELSGGMQQRVAVAMGVQLGPDLLIADEPTTALDVTIQAQILRLLLDVREQSGTGILFVTHDMTTVAEICDRVLVMYAGQIVESGPVVEVCTAPAHPYTRALLDAIPPLGGDPPEQLTTIPGAPPDPRAWPAGCRFAERCWLRERLGNPEKCTSLAPDLADLESERRSRCHFTEAVVR